MTCWNWKTGGTELSFVISVASFTLNRPSSFVNASAVREYPSLSPSGAKSLAMSELATQREHRDSPPVELGDAWTLRPGDSRTDKPGGEDAGVGRARRARDHLPAEHPAHHRAHSNGDGGDEVIPMWVLGMVAFYAG